MTGGGPPTGGGVLRALAQRIAGDDRGMLAPAALVLVLATAVIGIGFLRIGRATDLGAEAQTGADAAALAAAAEVRDQILHWVYSGGWYARPFVPDQAAARAEAESWAARNDTRLTTFALTQSAPMSFDVSVTTTTDRALPPPGRVDATPAPTPDGEGRFGAGQRGRQTATARVAQDPDAPLLLGYGGGGGGGLTPTGGSCPIPEPELRAAAAAAGLPEEFGVVGHGGGSALRRGASCDGGAAVAGLTEAMRASVLKLEHAMGVPLQINSAYRSPGYQARLCQNVDGPCAPPGRSLHGEGLAIDVGNHHAAAVAVAADPSIGLCQPLPVNDAVHFSHVTGRECGGRTGTVGTPFGGPAGLAALTGFEVGLIR